MLLQALVSPEANKDLETGFSIISACLVTLHWKDKAANQVLGRCISMRQEGIICLFKVACCGFSAGLCYCFNASFISLLVFIFIAFLIGVALYFWQVKFEFYGSTWLLMLGSSYCASCEHLFQHLLVCTASISMLSYCFLHLGGHIIFFQSLSLLSYCLFPLDIGALICLLIDNATVRLVVVAITIAWCSWVAYPFISAAINSRRKALALYLVFLIFIYVCFLIFAID